MALRLLIAQRMKALSVFAGTMWVIGMLLGFTMWAQSATVTHGVRSDRTDTPAVSLSGDRSEVETRDQFAEPRLDLYGNEISDAVGDYRIDGRGDIYERHAPDTAVLRLGPAGV